MLDPSLRDRLIDLIGRTPEVMTAAGRGMLLDGIPNDRYFMREEANLRTDVGLLVRQLQNAFGPAGEWWLLQLVTNAAKGVAGTELGTELMKVRTELTGMTPIVANPAAIASIFLFDLRQLVLRCLAWLPETPSLSGLVIPDATPTLLRHFCEGVRYRAPDLASWPRDRIDRSLATLWVGPLQTSVEKAIEQGKKAQGLLKMKHTLFPAYVTSATDAAALWQGVRDLTRATPHHLAVIFGMPASAAVPEGMRTLPTPIFTSQEVSTWITDIAKARSWELSVVKRSTAFVVTGYAEDAPLPVDVVYDRLQQYHDFVRDYRDDRALLQALNDRDGLGV